MNREANECDEERQIENAAEVEGDDRPDLERAPDQRSDDLWNIRHRGVSRGKLRLARNIIIQPDIE